MMKSMIICFVLTIGMLVFIIGSNTDNPKLVPALIIGFVFSVLMVVIPFTNNPISRWFDSGKPKTEKVE